MPGGPEGAPRQLKPEKPDQVDLIKPSGGPQGGADRAEVQGIATLFPKVCGQIRRRPGLVRKLRTGGRDP